MSNMVAHPTRTIHLLSAGQFTTYFGMDWARKLASAVESIRELMSWPICTLLHRGLHKLTHYGQEQRF